MHYIRVLAAALLLGRSFAFPVNDVVDATDKSKFHFYTTPTPGAGPCDMDTGPDGETIFYQDLIAAKGGVVYTKTGKVVDFDMPYAQGQPGNVIAAKGVTALQCIVRTGDDGMVYMSAGIKNGIVQVNPKTLKTKLFLPGQVAGNLFNFNDAWAMPYGLFFSQTTGNRVTLFNYKTQNFTYFIPPTPDSGPLGMRNDTKGNLWFTQFFSQQIAKLNPKTGEITEFNVALPGGAAPEVLRTLTQERYLWANAFVGGGFIMHDTVTNKQEIFTYPNGGPDSFPIENDSDPSGNVWFSSFTLNALVYYTPSTGKWTTIHLPSGTSPLPTGDLTIPVHYGPLNAMWFSNVATNQIGYYSLD